MARRGKILKLSQRILITHIIGLSIVLVLALLGGVWMWLAMLASAVATIGTVRRLLAQRSIRIILTRSLEPAFLVFFGLLYLVLLSTTYEVPLWQQSIFLLLIFIMQIRYLLLQFKSQSAHLQTGFTIALLILINTTWILVINQNSSLVFLAVLLAWLTNYITVHYWLERAGYHNSFLAGVWALLSVEILLVGSTALVFYTLPATLLVVSRTSLFLMVIGYAWGSMLSLHSKRKLSKKLVIEYGMICTLLLIVLLVMSGFY